MLVGRLVLSSGVGSGARSRAILRACLALAAGGAVGVWLAPNELVAGAGLFVAGLGMAALYPLGVGVALQQAPDAPVRASARLAFASGLAIFTLPLILGVIAQLVGVVTGWPIVIALVAVALLILTRLAAGPPAPVPTAPIATGIEGAL
jgi:MFS family permease